LIFATLEEVKTGQAEQAAEKLDVLSF